MSDPRRSERESLLDVLADRAMEPLSAEAERALVAAPRGSWEEDAASFERAAAALAEAFVAPSREPMPPALAARIAALGRAAVAPAPALPPAVPTSPAAALPAGPARRPAPLRAALGWYVAAAALLLAVAGWWPTLREALEPATAEARMRRFAARAADAKSGEWKTLSEFEGRPVTGSCVWSDSLQEGYLVFRGLPENAAQREQYQLWILVPGQKHPIDGGVFDAKPADGGELIVPVAAKLAVSEPTAFAVTIEKPGGVVVSDQSRLVLLASLAR